MKRLCKMSWRQMRYAGSMVGLLLCLPITLLAERCPFCYSKAASSSPNLFHALRSGVVILMVPSFLLSVGITVIAYRRRNSFHQR